jgi:hypothetical protein
LFKANLITHSLSAAPELRDLCKPPQKRTLASLIRRHLIKGKHKTIDILWLNGVKNMEEKLKKMFKYDEDNPDIS